jgi:hypothetical protein
MPALSGRPATDFCAVLPGLAASGKADWTAYFLFDSFRFLSCLLSWNLFEEMN